MTWTAIQPWIGGLIVIGTVYGIIKRWETRMVLLGSGLLMCLLALKPVEAFKAFEKGMTNAGLISAILSVMGFAYVMKMTKADEHLVHLVAGAVTRVRFALIPACLAATWACSIALPSASGVTAAVGAVLIPVMISAGIHPALAAATILAGNYGGNWNPGGTHNVMVSKMAGVNVLDVTYIMGMQAVYAAAVAAVALLVQGYLTREDRGHQSELSEHAEKRQANYLLAMVPLVPLALIVLGAQPAFKNWNLNVPTAMIIGSLLAIAVSRKSPAEITKAFFEGMGTAYGSTLGLIVCASVFTAGMTQIGLIQALLNNITGAKGAVGVVASLGPALMAVLTGSGDASTIAFNDAVTPHAAAFGWTIQNLGSMAASAAALGRSMSPVAAATMVAAGISGVSPVEIAKRTAIPMILGIVVSYLYVVL
jgi:DcuC family C4-dicarboxylate transporter